MLQFSGYNVYIESYMLASTVDLPYLKLLTSAKPSLCACLNVGCRNANTEFLVPWSVLRIVGQPFQIELAIERSSIYSTHLPPSDLTASR